MALWICPNLITKKTRFFINILYSEYFFFLSLGLTKVEKNYITWSFTSFLFHVLLYVADFCCDMCASRSGNSVISHVMRTQFFFHTPSTLVQHKTVCFSCQFLGENTIISVLFIPFLISYIWRLIWKVKVIFCLWMLLCIVFALNQTQHPAALFCIPVQTVNADRIYLIEN